MYLLLKMVNFQLGHLSLSPRTSTVAPRFQAPRFHVIAPVEERCSQYTPSSSSTMHREGINGIIHLKTALRFPVQQHQAQLIRRNGRGGGFYKFYKWKGGGGKLFHTFLFGTEKIFCEFVVRCFLRKQYKVKKTYLILDSPIWNSAKNQPLCRDSLMKKKPGPYRMVVACLGDAMIRFFKTTRLRDMGARIKLEYETHQ